MGGCEKGCEGFDLPHMRGNRRVGEIERETEQCGGEGKGERGGSHTAHFRL